MRSERDFPLAQLIGQQQTRAVQEALKPHLRAVGVETVLERIGKADRFFENIRHRGTLKVRDYLATCAALELDPVEFLRQALGDRVGPGIRTPRIIGRAWKRLRHEGAGVGKERLAELATLVQSQPRQTRRVLGREISRAKSEELPSLLGLYGSCYRVESDLDRAKVVLSRAREMARELCLRASEADILIRLAYVALEKNRLSEALRRTGDAIVLFARLVNHEGEGMGFLTLGTFRYYGKEYEEALEDFEATLKYSRAPQQRLAAHQCRAQCLIKLKRESEARDEIRRARRTGTKIDTWMEGKLLWTEADLCYGTKRLELLGTARRALSEERPADCALVTVQLVEEALSTGHIELAEREVRTLYGLVEKTGSPRVERAMLHLIRHQTRLTPKYVAQIRQAVERAQARRLARLIGTRH